MTNKDARPWVKVTVDYFDNPKIDSLSDQGQLLHLFLIITAGQKRSDGVINRRVAASKGAKALKELVAAGLVHERHDGQYVIHDYEKHQTASHHIEDKTDHKRAAGAAGGRKSNHVRNHVNKNIIKDGCEFCIPPAPELQSPGPIPF